MLSNSFKIVPNSIQLEAQGNALVIIAISKAPLHGDWVASKNNFFQNFLPKSLPVSKRNRNFVVWYIATSIIVKR